MSGGVRNSIQPKAQQAQWNVQVVRGKVTTRCLWNACKALSIGLLLLAVGTTMAVIGYYADQLSIRSETRGNFTVKIKNESRGFHLNNLSYAGPIVMGIGGFIVVAACVMTFEARDSAAKVVPARFKPNLNTSITGESKRTSPRTTRTFQRTGSRRSDSAQTLSGKRGPGTYNLEPIEARNDWFQKNDSFGRKAFTAAFVKFSRDLMENSAMDSHREWREKKGEAKLRKSPSAPDLAVANSGSTSLHATRRPCKGSPKGGNRSQQEFVCPLETISSNLFLRPNYLQRQAVSMDNPFYESNECYTPASLRLSRQQSNRSRGSRESFEMEIGSNPGVSDSQTSMALDLHDCQVTLKVKDESVNKKSETARRHLLLRQKPVEDDLVPKCSCIPRLLCTSKMKECNRKTKSSSNLKSLGHHGAKAIESCSRRGHTPKISVDFRSQSFSPTCSHGNLKKFGIHEDNLKIFFIEDGKKANLSSESIRLSEEKFRCAQKHSPIASPNRNSRSDCRVQRIECTRCFAHRAKDFSRACACLSSSERKRKDNQETEEQKLIGRRKQRSRSASVSPTAKKSAISTPLRDEGLFNEHQSLFSEAETSADENLNGKTETVPEKPS